MKEDQYSDQNSTFLDKVYDFAINGIPKIDKPIAQLVYEYRSKNSSTEKAIDEFIKYQRLKCTATGFVTGLGGLLTLPVAIPTDLTSSIYIETRMIATIAALRGYDINDDRVRTLIYLCFIGNSIGDVVKQAGIKGAEQLVVKTLLPKISGEIIKKINKAVGFRLLTKGGTKGLINLGKAVPIVGGIVGGTYNLIEINIFAKRAKKMFNENAN